MQVRRIRAVALAAGTLASLFAFDTFAGPRCESPPQHRADRIACEKARESPEALRRYIERTRAIHHLYFYDYMTSEEIDAHHAREETRQQSAEASTNPAPEASGARPQPG